MEQGINEGAKREIHQYLLTHGMTRKEATDFCERNIEIATFFKKILMQDTHL